MKREFFVCLAWACLLAGCAGTETATTDKNAADDPLEPLNRKVFALNHALDKHAALPAAELYVDTLPDGTRTGIHNVFSNLTMPVTFANDILQGEMTRAGDSICRFGVNTTWGILGIWDRASTVGCPEHNEDFGQTLGSYGVPGGPYLIMPFAGPNLPRDMTGQIFVDHYFSPLGYVTYGGKYYVTIGVNAIKTMDGRSRTIDEIAEIERSSIDFYAASRDKFLQRRAMEIANLPQNNTIKAVAKADEKP
jgi:phospholipid-binding lipoprotein MlaA